MKKLYITIFIFIALFAITYWVITNSGNSTIKKELSNFAVEDTASITKIFLADKNNKQVTLSRSQNGWLVDSKFEARKDIIDVLLTTIKKMRVRAPVPKSSFENIVKNIATNSVKVEIYMGGNKPAKTFFVGGPNQEHNGTYMLLENSNVPFLMHIEGFRGYLSSRFFTNVNDWKSTKVFNYNPKQIAEIQIEYPKNPKNSFTLKQNNENNPEIILLHNQQPLQLIDTGYVDRYLWRYKQINFEGFEETKSKQFIDSIKTSTPMVIYTVTDVTGKKQQIKLYPKPAHKGAEDYDGNKIEYDLDRLYGWLNDEDFVVIQYQIFDPLKKLPTDFTLKK